MFNKKNYIPKDERKKILLLSDDLRLNSGVGVMSREIVKHTAHHYNWFQVGAAVKHPDNGKIIDVSNDINIHAGIEDSYVKILPNDGYGNPDLLRDVMTMEKPDAILHYTDPRFWIWLYQMENEIRQNIPIFFYSIWDDLPYPKYNKPYYLSCDWIGCISKQTHNLIHQVADEDKFEDWQVTYIPHGIDQNIFYPISKKDQGKLHEIGENKEIKTDYELMVDFRLREIGDDKEFVLLFNSRNIRRKMVGDIVLAYKEFCDNLPEDEASKCILVLHTAAVDQNGTDIPAMVEAVCPEHNIKITNSKTDTNYLNYLYNIADVTINLSSAEGFGLSMAESIMAGTPVILNSIGGLQDQAGFKKENGEYLTIDDYNKEWGSNSDGKYTEHGEWAQVVFPKTVSLVGSPPTPYIFDSRCDWKDAAEKILYWYNKTDEERTEAGALGREFLLKEEIGMSAGEMGNRFIKDMNKSFEMYKKKESFSLLKI